MADDNRPIKYVRYAIGEIVLVVIGILIALQINNWNEERKDNQKLKMYVKGLIADLEKDTISLNRFITWSNTEINQLKEVGEYFNRPDSVITIDSIINFLPNINFMNPGPSPFNKETFNTLVATGHVGLIPEKQMEDLKRLNFFYKDFEDSSQGSRKLITEALMDYLNTYAYLTNDEKNSLVYLTQMEYFNEVDFLRVLTNYVGFKTFLYGLMSTSAQQVLKQSEKTLASLKDIQ